MAEARKLRQTARRNDMIPVIVFIIVLFLAMLLPYLPGRYDASASTLSFVTHVASYTSLLLAPIGLGWVLWPKRLRLWRRLGSVLAGTVVLVMSVSAIAVNQTALGVILGLSTLALLRSLLRRLHADSKCIDGVRRHVAVCLMVVPVVLVMFATTALPRAAVWSRNRAIQCSSALITEIEAFRMRRGHYPASLQSLNRDVRTGVIGIERFHYEPAGEAYNLFFVRPSVAIDANEVVIFNPRDEQRFTSHELDILQYDGEQLDMRRGDRRRTVLPQPHWQSILFD